MDAVAPTVTLLNDAPTFKLPAHLPTLPSNNPLASSARLPSVRRTSMTTTTNLIHSRTHAPTLTTGINQSPIQLPAATALPIPVHIPTILGKPPLALNRQPSPFDGLSNQRTTAEPVVLTTQWDYQPEVYFQNSMLRKELTKVAAIVNNHGRPESRYCFPCACCQENEHHLHQCPIFGSCWDNRQPGVMRCGW
jgi:hypothetical protein